MTAPFTAHDVATILAANDRHHSHRDAAIAAEREITDGAYFGAHDFAERRHLIRRVGQVTETTSAGRRWIRHPH